MARRFFYAHDKQESIESSESRCEECGDDVPHTTLVSESWRCDSCVARYMTNHSIQERTS